ENFEFDFELHGYILIVILLLDLANLNKVLQILHKSIHLRNDFVNHKINNSLVCFVNNFFPPPVQVKWTKNDVNITKEVKLSPYFFNTDITFYHFSTLTFDPEDGDLYTCTVDFSIRVLHVLFIIMQIGIKCHKY
uniref:Ig-like domain-containing protein n=1 Tax=Esox lucius TaxID=8010 RepID=A0AAY5K1R7_ESOLU